MASQWRVVLGMIAIATLALPSSSLGVDAVPTASRPSIPPNRPARGIFRPWTEIGPAASKASPAVGGIAASGLRLGANPSRRTAQQLAQGEQQESRSKLAEAFSQDKQLHGAWIATDWGLEPDDVTGQDRYVLRLIVESSRAAQQQQAVLNMLETIPFDRNYRVASPLSLPSRQLVAAMNLAIEARPSLDGCIVESAYYGPGDPAGQNIYLAGRVHDEAQRKELESVFDSLRQQDRTWEQVQNQLATSINPRFSTLVPERATQEMAEDYYNSGLAYFWRQDYDTAKWHFQHAAVESPRSNEYRYWLILCDLKSGNRQDAYHHMLALVRRGEYSDRSRRSVLCSLERIQGRLRKDLMNMELRAHAEPRTDTLVRRTVKGV